MIPRLAGQGVDDADSIRRLKLALGTAQRELMECKVLLSAGGGDVNSTKQNMASLEARVDEIRRTLAYYGVYPMSDVAPDRQTRAVFS